MNIQQMRYVLEVEKTGSISQAAENLYMDQPNLSKAIKELELSMGIGFLNAPHKALPQLRVVNISLMMCGKLWSKLIT